MEPIKAQSLTDQSLLCLSVLFRFHGISFDPASAARNIAPTGMVIEDAVRLARDHGLKARIVHTTRERLEKTPLPAAARGRNGGFFLVAKIVGDKVLMQSGVSQRPELVPIEQLDEIWDGTLILVTRRAALGDTARQFGIGWFLSAMHKYRRILVEVLVASFFLQIFALASPLFFQVVIDKVLVNRGSSTLDILVIGLVTVGVFETVLGILRTYVFSHTTNRIDVELGARLYRHLLALPLGYFGVRRVGDSVARVRELENIRQFITSSALTLVIDLLFTVVFLALMACYSLELTGIVLISLPLYFIISLTVAPLFRSRLDERFRRGAENQAFLVETVTGIETLKSMAVEGQMQRRWEEQLSGYVSASFNVTNLGNYTSQSIQLISKLVTAGLLFFGARAVISGSLTVGELVAFNMLSGRVSQPVLRLAQIWQDFHQARLSIARLGDILNTNAEPNAGGTRVSLPPIKGRITFDQVVFRYRIDAPEVLRSFSIDIPPGQTVGIVGSSGSGKSTLAKMVQRLYTPESGRVLVDGVDLAMADPVWLRRQIGVVLQDNILFRGTIRENIALSDPGTPVQQIIAAAELAGAHEFILQLPEGYDTMVGERGASLSGGQRQRIAIARALMTNPRILILDEATSALDYESEQAIQRNMRHICAGRTVLIIAHRLSAVRHCHRIIAVENGALVEDGGHDELLQLKGRYARLHSVQSGITDAA